MSQSTRNDAANSAPSTREARERTRVRDIFLANMSHDLRSPLATIMGAAEALLEGIYGDLNNEQRRTVADIYATSEEVLALVSDVLDLSRIRFGEIQLVMEQIDLRQLIHDTIHLSVYQQASASISWNVHLPSTPIDHWCDAQRVRQILGILLDAAVRQCHDNGVVTVRLEADGKQGVVRITIRDTGDGIPEHRRARIFEPFAFDDDSADRAQTASGLSMAIVQKLVDLHGGLVTVESEVGLGTTFHVTLPWAHATPSTSPRGVTSKTSVRRTDPDSKDGAKSEGEREGNTIIFIVDDNPMQCQLLESFARQSGFTVLSFQRGAECLRMLDEVWPDIMIVDLQMPEMDGLTLIERVREIQAHNRDEVLIVALTALSMPGDREACMAAGASRFLTKPISYREFMQELQHHGGRPSAFEV